jgi:hypothetical protein
MTHLIPQGLAATELFLQHFKENFFRALEGWSQMACSYTRRGGVRSFISAPLKKDVEPGWLLSTQSSQLPADAQPTATYVGHVFARV